MSDKVITVSELKEQINAFVKEREWDQFHLPKNLSMALAAEAAELMELFLWVESKNSYDTVTHKREQVEDEVADIFVYLLAFCNQNQIDLSSALMRKMAKNAQKYPVEKSRGNAKKYTEI